MVSGAAGSLLCPELDVASPCTPLTSLSGEAFYRALGKFQSIGIVQCECLFLCTGLFALRW